MKEWLSRYGYHSIKKVPEALTAHHLGNGSPSFELIETGVVTLIRGLFQQTWADLDGVRRDVHRFVRDAAMCLSSLNLSSP